MPTYSYTARSKTGRRSRGTLDAESYRHARQLLRERALLPIQIDEVEAQTQFRSGFSFRLTARMSSTDLALFTRQLSSLIASAIPLDEALRASALQTDKPHVRNIISTVRSRILAGHPLAEGLAVHPSTFDQLYRAMVAAGEKAGRLEAVLARLADYKEQQQKVRNRLVQAMIYPFTLTSVAISVIVILLTTVVPQIVEQFLYMKQQLPFSTRSLMAISELVISYGMYVFIFGCVSLVLWFRWLREASNLQRYHALLLKLPVIGKVSRGVNGARFSRTLSILNASAVPLLEAIQISGDVLSNIEAKARIAEAKESVREGSNLHSALERTHLFPPVMLHMIAAGERSGELDSMLLRAADNQDNDFENRVAIMLSAFEPALVIFMAVIVLFIVLAVLQPILQLNNAVGI